MPYYAVFGTILQEQARRMRRVVSEIIFRPFILKFISLPPSQAIKGLAAKISNYAVFEKNQLFTVFFRFSEVCHCFSKLLDAFHFFEEKKLPPLYRGVNPGSEYTRKKAGEGERRGDRSKRNFKTAHGTGLLHPYV